MYKKGAVSSIHEAFVKYIGNNASCYVKRMKVGAKEAIELIKDMGGISILAHPKTINVKLKSLEDIVSLLISYGLQGIEVYHTDHKNKDIERLDSLAKRYNILITGGSDCHGLNNRKVLIGKVRIPYELVEKLKSSVG
jgi:predicted metal-dependent phosphoesterase TrpH